jgi:hypothetical protein
LRAKSADELLEILHYSEPMPKILPNLTEKVIIKKVENQPVTLEPLQINEGIMNPFAIVFGLFGIGLLSWFLFYKAPNVNISNEGLLIEKARTEGTLPAWNHYLKRFPEGNYAAEAHRIVDSLVDLKDKYMKNAKIMLKGEERNMAKQDYENILRIDPQDANVKRVLETLRTEL